MLTLDDLIRDRDNLIVQIQQYQGALGYIKQKISMLSKATAAKENGKTKEDIEESVTEPVTESA